MHFVDFPDFFLNLYFHGYIKMCISLIYTYISWLKMVLQIAEMCKYKSKSVLFAGGLGNVNSISLH